MRTMMNKAIYLIVAVALAVSLLTGCGNKNPVTTDDFISLARQKDYIVEDGSPFFEDYNYIKQATIVAPQDESFQIEFYELNDEASAKSFYENNKNNFIMMKNDDSIDKVDSGGNYDLYKLEMYGRFMMIERVQTTVVYVHSTDSTNKTTIESFLSELKY